VNPISSDEILSRIGEGDIIKNELNLLPERRREIIYARYGFDEQDEQTLEEIGSKMHITRERVRQLGKSALERLSKNTNIKLFRD
jgi:RNA polymerase primary sigma factor